MRTCHPTLEAWLPALLPHRRAVRPRSWVAPLVSGASSPPSFWAAGPPAGGRATTYVLRPWGRILRFLLRFVSLFPVCWCRSPTSTIEAPVSVDTLAPDSLSQQVYSRVRQSLAGAIAQPRPCASLRFNPAAQTIQPCCKGEAEHRVLELGFYLNEFTWLRRRRPCCRDSGPRPCTRKNTTEKRPCAGDLSQPTVPAPCTRSCGTAPCRV